MLSNACDHPDNNTIHYQKQRLTFQSTKVASACIILCSHFIPFYLIQSYSLMIYTFLLLIKWQLLVMGIIFAKLSNYIHYMIDLSQIHTQKKKR